VTADKEEFAITAPIPDSRTADRRARDAQIAAEPQLSLPQLPDGATAIPVKTHLARLRGQAMAVAGIVENGFARPIDLAFELSEHSRVTIVAEAD